MKKAAWGKFLGESFKMKSFRFEFGLRDWSYQIPSGQSFLDLNIPEPFPPSDPIHLIQHALEHPFGYPRLREALTPDDHLAIVLDDTIPSLVPILCEVLGHIQKAGVLLENVTIIIPPNRGESQWVEQLPEELDGIRIENHHPGNQKELCYLGTSQEGERLYLNRTLVEADQAIVLGKRFYDPVLGRGGAQGDIFPALADDKTIASYSAEAEVFAGSAPSRAALLATEVSWLLGAPYFIQVLEGSGGTIQDIIAGSVQASSKAEEELDRIWMRNTPSSAQAVVALVGRKGEPVTFSDLCKAAYCASKVVKKQGSIILLSDAPLDLDKIRAQIEGSLPGKKTAKLIPNPDIRSWMDAAAHARIHLTNPDAPRLMAASILKEADLTSLLSAASSVLVIPDAHRVHVRVSKHSKS